MNSCGPVRFARVVLATGAALFTSTVAARGALAQPGAIEPAPAPQDPLAALEAVPTPLGWSRTSVAAWRDAAGLTVTAERQPGTCLERQGFAGTATGLYFDLPSEVGARARCLQRLDDVVIVRFGWGLAVANTQQYGVVDTLHDQIAAALRPATDVPGVGTLRTRLPIEPSPDGVVIRGLSAPVSLRVRALPGSCGMAPPEPSGSVVVSLAGARWAVDPRLSGDRASFCLERQRDALAVILDGPLAGPPAPYGAQPTPLHPELRTIVEALHDEVARTDPAPRWFGRSADRVDLPQVGITLRGDDARGNGWSVDHTPGRQFKLVDGAVYGEPDTDLLVPREPGRHAIGFRRGPCALASSQPGGGLTPRELGPIEREPGGRSHLCVRAPGATFHVVLRELDAGALDDRDDVRDVLAAFALSVGVPVAGRPSRTDLALLLGIASASTGTGVVVRGRAAWQTGRPLSLSLRAEAAFGVAGDDFHPGEAAAASEDEIKLPGDALVEGRVAIGGAYTLGPLTADVAVGATLADYWPGRSWLDTSVGLAAWRGRDRLGVRYEVTPLRWSQAVELTVARPPVAVMLRALTLPDLAGSSTRGLELAIGITR